MCCCRSDTAHDRSRPAQIDTTTRHPRLAPCRSRRPRLVRVVPLCPAAVAGRPYTSLSRRHHVAPPLDTVTTSTAPASSTGTGHWGSLREGAERVLAGLVPASRSLADQSQQMWLTVLRSFAAACEHNPAQYPNASHWRSGR